jgi:hypothetical protein
MCRGIPDPAAARRRDELLTRGAAALVLTARGRVTAPGRVTARGRIIWSAASSRSAPVVSRALPGCSGVCFCHAAVAAVADAAVAIERAPTATTIMALDVLNWIFR